MSLAEVQARISQIESLTVSAQQLGAPVAAPAPTQISPASFARTLQAAATTAAPAATVSPAPAGVEPGVAQWTSQIEQASQQTGVDANLIRAVMTHESGGDQSARSPVGAIGLMQLMPGTAAGLGVDPTDPSQNILGGARYLKQLLDEFHGDKTLAVAAYNAGPGAVKQYNGVPPYAETQRYVQLVIGTYDSLSAQNPSTQQLLNNLTLSPSRPIPTEVNQ